MAQLTEYQEEFARDYGEVTNRTMSLEDFLATYEMSIDELDMVLDKNPALLKYTEDIAPDEDEDDDDMTREPTQAEIDAFNAEYGTGEYTDMSDDDKGDWQFEELEAKEEEDGEIALADSDFTLLNDPEALAAINEAYEGGGAESGLTPADSLVGEGVVTLAGKLDSMGVPPWLTGAMVIAATKGKKKGMLSTDKSRVLNTDKSRVLNTDKSRVLNDKTKKQRDLFSGSKTNTDKSKVLNTDKSRVLNTDKSRVLNTDKSRVLNTDKSRVLNTDKSRVLKSNKNLKSSTANASSRLANKKVAKPSLTMAERAALSAPFAVTALNLIGNRDKDGSLKVESKKEVPIVEGKPIKMKKEERPGWHKQEGTNFWNVNSKSPHWKTEEGGLEAEKLWGSRPGWVKQREPEEEIDWSAFWN